MLNLKDRDFKDLETLKRAIKRQLGRRKIGIRAEISENLLREIFSEVKEKIKQKTKYEVDKFDFPKNYLSAWLFWKRDYRKFREFVFDTHSETERKKTEQVWKEEYSKEEPFSTVEQKGAKNFTLVLKKNKDAEETFFLIVLSSRNRDSLRHEFTHYFEIVMKLPYGSLLHIWKWSVNSVSHFVMPS